MKQVIEQRGKELQSIELQENHFLNRNIDAI